MPGTGLSNSSGAIARTRCQSLRFESAARSTIVLPTQIVIGQRLTFATPQHDIQPSDDVLREFPDCVGIPNSRGRLLRGYFEDCGKGWAMPCPSFLRTADRVGKVSQFIHGFCIGRMMTSLMNDSGAWVTSVATTCAMSSDFSILAGSFPWCGLRSLIVDPGQTTETRIR